MIHRTNLFEDLPEYIELREDLVEDIAHTIMVDVVEPLVERLMETYHDTSLTPGYWNYEHIIQVIVIKMKEHQDKLDRMDDLSNRNE